MLFSESHISEGENKGGGQPRRRLGKEKEKALEDVKQLERSHGPQVGQVQFSYSLYETCCEGRSAFISFLELGGGYVCRQQNFRKCVP